MAWAHKFRSARARASTRRSENPDCNHSDVEFGVQGEEFPGGEDAREDRGSEDQEDADDLGREDASRRVTKEEQDVRAASPRRGEDHGRGLVEFEDPEDGEAGGLDGGESEDLRAAEVDDGAFDGLARVEAGRVEQEGLGASDELVAGHDLGAEEEEDAPDDGEGHLGEDWREVEGREDEAVDLGSTRVSRRAFHL